MSPRIVLLSTVIAALVAVVACSKNPAACTVDLDCGEGSFCRSGECAAVARDGGVAADGAAIICVSPGSTCTTDNDCCSPPCSSAGRCAGGAGSSGKTSSGGTSGTSGTSGASGTTSSGGGCLDVYAICSFDGECCSGLSCDPSGTCR